MKLQKQLSKEHCPKPEISIKIWLKHKRPAVFWIVSLDIPSLHFYGKTKLHSLSAGRVQSVALRMVVEREQERIKFIPAGWWDLQNEVVLQGDFVDGQGIEAYPNHQVISAKLRHWDGKRIAEGSSFNDRGELTKKDQVVLDKTSVHEIISTLQELQKKGTYAVVESREENLFF